MVRSSSLGLFPASRPSRSCTTLPRAPSPIPADTIPDPLGAMATLLANGKVLFTILQGAFSGKASNPVVGAGKLYDPVAHTFSPTEDSDYYIATLLMNGKVLFVGDPNDD